MISDSKISIKRAIILPKRGPPKANLVVSLIFILYYIVKIPELRINPSRIKETCVFLFDFGLIDSSKPLWSSLGVGEIEGG